MKLLTNFDVAGKRILVRCDFNVPLDDNGQVSEDFKIRQTLPTINYLRGKGAKIILMSHLGDKETAPSLEPVKKVLESVLGFAIKKTDDCIGTAVENEVLKLQDGEVLLLENVRMHKEEKENNPEFAKELSHLADIYINDAFAVCHRNHASVAGVPQYLPHGAGLLLEKEVENLGRILQNPVHPMLALVGGTKVSTKATFIEKISQVADVVIVSGLIKKEMQENSRLRQGFGVPKEKIIGPVGDLAALDISEESITLFKEHIMAAKTILWNGPFGKYEDEQYKKGTLEIAKAIVASGAFSVAGGGETVEFLQKEGMMDQFSHVSTGGGAMLAYLAGEELPGLKALE